MECPQRLAVNHQRDCDMVGATDAVLHHADFLRGVLRQMAGVVAADKAVWPSGSASSLLSKAAALALSTPSRARQRPIPASEACAAAIRGAFHGILGHLSDVHHRGRTQPVPAPRRALRPKMRGLTLWSQPSHGTFKAPGGYYIGKRCRFAL